MKVTNELVKNLNSDKKSRGSKISVRLEDLGLTNEPRKQNFKVDK